MTGAELLAVFALLPYGVRKEIMLNLERAIKYRSRDRGNPNHASEYVARIGDLFAKNHLAIEEYT